MSGRPEPKPGTVLWRYRHPFRIDGLELAVVIRARTDGLRSELLLLGVPVATDATPIGGPEAVRNHRLATDLPDGRRVEVEAGWKEGSAEVATRGYDLGAWKRNRAPLAVDLALGLLFYVVAKLTDLTTAALVGAIVGLCLVVLQRFIRTDIIGGLALFGVVMLLVSAGLALAFQDDAAVKLRTTIVGLIGATLFLGDGLLLKGRRLGRGMARYLPYNDIDPARLAVGMGALGLFMAGLNLLVARLASTDVWLFYSTFVDFVLVFGLVFAVFRYARTGRAAAAPG